MYKFSNNFILIALIILVLLFLIFLIIFTLSTRTKCMGGTFTRGCGKNLYFFNNYIKINSKPCCPKCFEKELDEIPVVHPTSTLPPISKNNNKENKYMITNNSDILRVLIVENNKFNETVASIQSEGYELLTSELINQEKFKLTFKKKSKIKPLNG